MDNYIKNFDQFLAEEYGTESIEPTYSLQEAITLEIDEHVAILEAVGSLQGMPAKWMKVVTDRYDALGGENSIRQTLPIKATQKKKVFGYLKMDMKELQFLH